MSSKERLLALCENPNSKNAAKIINAIKLEKIIIVLTELIKTSSENVLPLLQVLFKHLPETEEQKEKEEIIKSIFNLFNSSKLSEKVCTEITGFLRLELESIHIKVVLNLTNTFVEEFVDKNIKNASWLGVFNAYMCTLADADSIPTAEGSMMGDEYKRMTMERLLNCNWNVDKLDIAIHLFRELALHTEKLKSTIERITGLLGEVRLEKFSSVVYQLLLLTNKEQGCKQAVFEHVISYFEECPAEPVDEELNPFLRDNMHTEQLRDAKLHTITSFNRVAKLDQTVGKEFIKFLKTDSDVIEKKVLTPFCILLSLSLTDVHRIGEQIFDILKSLILKVYNDDERRNSSKWVRDLFPSNINIEKSLASILNDISDHETVVKLNNLGLLLFECYSPKISDNFTISSTGENASQRVCLLGTKIMQDIFKKHESVRELMIKNLLDVVILKVHQNIKHYLDLITSLVASVPQIVLDCISKFRDVFDYVTNLNRATAEGLLRAVLPLMKVSLAMKDSLLLVLRKCMYSKHCEARKIAVTGFLLILKHFIINAEGVGFSLPSQIAFSQSYSCSQVVVSTQGRYNVAANEAFCLEVLGCLKKCLTQNFDVRKQLYEGIYEVSCKNPQLSNSVLDLIFTQFLKYYNRDPETTLPIDLDASLEESEGKIQLTEPFGWLMYALQINTKKSGKRLERDEEEDESLSNLLDDVEDSLASLTKRIIKCELEDFQLDKTSDFSTSKEGTKNQLNAKLLFNVYEILIEYNFMKNESVISFETCELVQELYKKHQKLASSMKDSEGKKSQSSKNKQTTTPLLSFKCLAYFFKNILSDTSEAKEPGLNALRQSVDFTKFIGLALCKKLQQVIETKHCEGAGGNNLQHIFRHSLEIAKSALQHINGDSLFEDDVIKRDKGKKLTSICLDILSAVIGVCCVHTSSQLPTLLHRLDFSPDLITQSDAITSGSLVFKLIRRIQRMSIKVISSPDVDFGAKETHVLMTTLSYLIPHLPNDGEEFQQVFQWFSRLCTEHTINDIILAKYILSKYLKLHHQCKPSTALITKMCQDVHSVIGDLDEGIEVEDSYNFTIISEKTGIPTAFLLLLDHLEVLLGEVSWCLTKLKSCSQPEDIEKLQQTASQVLIGVIFALHELCQTAFPHGLCADTLTKVLTKLYTILATFAKELLSMYTQGNGTIAPKFERMVRLSGSHLSQQVYTAITYIQSIQSNQKKKSKSKKKENLVGKNRALKESKFIPNLIFSIEQYERYLIPLSKKSKIDLMENMKRSTSRDFRINTKSLESALRDDNELLDLTNEEEAEETTSSHAPLANNSLLWTARDNVAGPSSRDKAPERTSREQPSQPTARENLSNDTSISSSSSKKRQTTLLDSTTGTLKKKKKLYKPSRVPLTPMTPSSNT